MKILFILITLFIMGCGEYFVQDDPLLIKTHAIQSDKKDYKFMYIVQYRYIPEGQFSKKTESTWFYSNDSLKIGTLLYLREAKWIFI